MMLHSLINLCVNWFVIWKLFTAFIKSNLSWGLPKILATIWEHCQYHVNNHPMKELICFMTKLFSDDLVSENVVTNTKNIFTCHLAWYSLGYLLNDPQVKFSENYVPLCLSFEIMNKINLLFHCILWVWESQFFWKWDAWNIWREENCPLIDNSENVLHIL